MNNFWYLDRRTQTVVVFVHGIFSDSRDCWFYEDREDSSVSMYWPALIQSDLRFADASIYLGGYYTAIDSGPYEIRDCADELFRALQREGEDGSPPVLSRDGILFICHSTGGIIARYLLESNVDRFRTKTVGLLLIASPSYGSKWADRLKLLARLYHQQLGAQLRWGNWSLRDLDARFRDLVNNRTIPKLIGLEAFENRFVFHRKWLPDKNVVVTEESAGRYFGAPKLLRETDHLSCVKPRDTRHPAHELLVDFWYKFTLLRSPHDAMVGKGDPAHAAAWGGRGSGKGPLSHTVPPKGSHQPSHKTRHQRQDRLSYEENYRTQMIHRVRRDWIAGVLYSSLYKIGGIKLDLADRADAVEERLNTAVRVPGQAPVPMKSNITKLFADTGDALLILGGPGSGKTTLLLRLTKDLLARAKQNTEEPVPVVFNLSSWAIRRFPLSQWLIAELHRLASLPKTLAQRWVQNERVIPLLDGLDEVATEYRPLCVEAINDFRRQHTLLPIAVCSRIADYDELSTKLRLPFAVEIRPLTRTQIKDYLERIGKPLQAVQEALRRDPTLWELLDTPLMLSVTWLAYRDAPFEFSPRDNLEQRRKHLFAKFVDEMLSRRPGAPYSPKHTRHWLSALALGLAKNHETVFYLEDLRLEWLPTRVQEQLSEVGTFLAVWVLIGLILGVIDASVKGLREGVATGLAHGVVVGVTYGLVYALFSAVLGAVMEIRPFESVRIVLMDGSRLWRAILIGVIGGVVWGFIVAIFDGSVAGTVEGLFVGLIVGTARLVSSQPKETRRVPNQGTHQSLKVAVGAVVVIGLAVGIAVGPFRGFFTGLILGLLGGLVFGGLFCLQHFVLRLMLWVNRRAPVNFAHFLNYAADRLLLRKVGGGYIFTHRMLAEYFASLRTEKPPT